MPKVAQPRRHQFLRDPVPVGPCSASTQKRRDRALKIQEKSEEMDFRCERCEKENLRCFVDTRTGHCAGCIAAHAECTLFVPEAEWEKVQTEREREELEVARLEAEQSEVAARLAARRVKLLEVKNKERSFARRDLALLDAQDKAHEVPGESSSPEKERVGSGTNPGVVVSSRSELSTDLGWSQADFDPSFFLDPSWSAFDLEFFFPDTSGGTPVPIPCSP